MCGIAGVVDPSGGPVDLAWVRAMTAALAPRGPDGEGHWNAPGLALGHRRLKIVDLSDEAAQPMVSADGAVALVCNGEIYNFLDLRAELRGRGFAFRTRSDSEVVLHGYEAWGEEVLDRLDGMFAFALWDGRRRRLLLARDRMGKKPLYFANLARPAGQAPLLAFASEVKALRLLPGFDAEVDAVALQQYLAFEFVPPPRTIFRGASKLDAGECLVWQAERGSGVKRYWDLPFPETPRATSASEAAETLRLLLRRAVERRLMGDVPVGLFLSGGLDSSAILAELSGLGGGAAVATFTLGFADRHFDESHLARQLAAQFHTDHRERRMDDAGLRALWPKVCGFLDEPFADPSVLPTFAVSQLARERVPVMLGGDGGDELWGGYPTLLADRLVGGAFTLLPPALHRSLQRLGEQLPPDVGYMGLPFQLTRLTRGGQAPGPRRHQRWLSAFLPEEQFMLLAPDRQMVPPTDPFGPLDERAATGPARRPADRVMDFYLRFYLGGDLNVKVDRAAGAVGLEVREPFQDLDLVRFACALAPHVRQQLWPSKALLRRAYRGILPDSVVRRSKRGFAVPVSRWLRGEWAPLLRDELHPDKIRREGFFNPVVVATLVDEHAAGRRDHRKALWTLLMFEKWLKNFGPGG